MKDALTNQIHPLVVVVGGPVRDQLEADLLPKSGTLVPRKASRGQNAHPY